MLGFLKLTVDALRCSVLIGGIIFESLKLSVKVLLVPAGSRSMPYDVKRTHNNVTLAVLQFEPFFFCFL
jgi:hypothetical protein